MVHYVFKIITGLNVSAVNGSSFMSATITNPILSGLNPEQLTPIDPVDNIFLPTVSSAWSRGRETAIQKMQWGEDHWLWPVADSLSLQVQVPAPKNLCSLSERQNSPEVEIWATLVALRHSFDPEE